MMKKHTMVRPDSTWDRMTKQEAETEIGLAMLNEYANGRLGRLWMDSLDPDVDDAFEVPITVRVTFETGEPERQERGQPRMPTLVEMDELLHHHADVMDAGDWQTWVGWIAGAWIAVFDDYISDGPGYAGKVMVVVWPGGPEARGVYVWRDGKIALQGEA